MEMLQKFVIFSLCLATTHADGKFSVLITPKAVSFSGSTPIESQYVGDILNVAMGNSADLKVQWDGLTITDPFDLADRVIAVIVCGIENIELDGNAKKYDMEGDSVHVSLFALSISLEMDNIPMCSLDLISLEEAVRKFAECFGEGVEAIIPNSEILKSDVHSVDKEFLHSVGFINAAAENLVIMRQKSHVMFIHLSMESLRDTHGEDSDVMNEAGKLAAEAIHNLNEAVEKSVENDILFVVINQHAETGGRRKREVAEGEKNKLNIATYYNQDYPVIFNIILWFMVAFFFSLLAVCYAIAYMDPGRDSIIYRMTATRGKKDI